MRAILPFILFLLLCNPVVLKGQSSKIDSLKKLLTGEKDTIQAKILLQLSWQNQGKPEEAFKYATKALKMAKDLNHPSLISSAYNALGVFYLNQGEFDPAMSNLLSALKIKEELKDLKGQANVLSNIGIIHSMHNDLDGALEYFLRTLQIKEQIKDTKEVSGILNNIGSVYLRKNDYNKAMEYYKKALKIKEQSQDSAKIAIAYNNIGIVYQKQKKYTQALEYFNKTLQIEEKLDNLRGQASVLISIGEVYLEKKQPAVALGHLFRSLEYARKSSSKDLLPNIYTSVANCYAEQGNYKSAYEYQEKLIQIKDSLFDTDMNQKLSELRIRNDLQRKERILLEQKKRADELELKQKSNLINFFIVTIFLLAVLAVVILNRYVIKRRSLEALQRKNEEIFRYNEELNKINAELKNAKEEADHANKVKSEFLAHISHDFRTPINGIVGWTNALQEELKDPKTTELIQMIQTASLKLSANVNNILNYINIESKKITIRRFPIDLKQILDEKINFYKLSAQQKGLKFEFKLPENEFIANVESDADKITYILDNLIENAIKFTSVGTISLVIEQKLETEAVEVTRVIDLSTQKQNIALTKFIIKDTGIGIHESDYSRMFQPFTQLDWSTTKRFQGTGLGLVISKHFANLMKGDITFTSEYGAGSTFTLELPLPVAPQVIEKLKQEPLVKDRPLKILVAEDDEISSKFMCHILRRFGWLFETAFNGEEAIEKYKSSEFDIILMDGAMPIIDGLEATKYIRTIEEKSQKHIPIIAVTGYALEGDRERFLQAGMDDYITKPVKEAQLFALIKKYTNVA